VTSALPVGFDIELLPEGEPVVTHLISGAGAIPTEKHWSLTLDRMTHWVSSVQRQRRVAFAGRQQSHYRSAQRALLLILQGFSQPVPP
jgi:hypothetical protein